MSIGGLVTGSDDKWKEYTESQITDLKTTIQTEKGHYDDQTLAQMQAQLETYELSLKYDVNFIYGNDTWKGNLLYEIQDLKENIALAEKRGGAAEDTKKEVNEKIKLIESDNFSGYIKLRKDETKKEFDSKKINEEEYNEKIYLLDIEEKYEIYKDDSEENQGKQSIYRDICSIKQNLRTGINSSTGKILNAEELEKLEDNLKIAEYRLEKNIPSVDGSLTRKECI